MGARAALQPRLRLAEPGAVHPADPGGGLPCALAGGGRRLPIRRRSCRRLEVHVFDFWEGVYGRRIRVECVQKLREEARFDSIQELTAAIRRDADQARAVLDGATA